MRKLITHTHKGLHKTYLRLHLQNLRQFCQKETEFNSQVEEVKQMSEFKNGMKFLSEGKFDSAEYHFKECLKIFKSINQTDSLAYVYTLKKYTQSLFYLSKFSECEKYLQASVEISRGIFNNTHELMFPYVRNLLAFYTYSDIEKASAYADDLISSLPSGSKPVKYFVYANGAIKLLHEDFAKAKMLMNKAMEYEDLPQDFQAFNLHNLGLLHWEQRRSLSLKSQGQDRDNDIKAILIPFKQCLAKLELNCISNKNDEEIKLVTNFLHSDSEMFTDDFNVDKLINTFTNPNSGLTLTCLSEMFFEEGKDKEKETAFWLKLGIKHYENYEKENIARHLIVFALFYSQLGQTLLAEGLYRRALDLLKKVT